MREHIGLTFKYPGLHARQMLIDIGYLNLLDAVTDVISMPLSFVFFALGLITRTFATIGNFFFGCDTDLQSNQDTEELEDIRISVLT